MSFPSSIPSYTGFTSSETLAVAQHASQHNQEQGDITAIATKIGTGASTPTNNVFLVGNGAGSSAWRTINSSDIGFSPLSVLQQVYPVGCIYTEITGTNPGTTFGLGTWLRYGQGEVLVGQKTGDTNFGTVGNTGGESTHLLTGAESGTSVHGHGVTDPGHLHTQGIVIGGADGVVGSPAVGITVTNTGTSTTGLTVNNSSASNASNAHNNLQPFIVVYFWQRTA
jgi:microcystin-dependent protein